MIKLIKTVIQSIKDGEITREEMHQIIDDIYNLLGQ
jgi:hypothetical protein